MLYLYSGALELKTNVCIDGRLENLIFMQKQFDRNSVGTYILVDVDSPNSRFV